MFSWIGAFYVIPLPERLFSTHSPMLLYRDKQVAHIQLASDDRWRTETHLENVDPTYIASLLSIEDERFWWHFGFDPLSIGRAILQNIFSGEVISGASTITMQLVRLMEPRPRTYRSKMIEVWRATQLEWFLSKEQILEYYLTFIPYGRNVEGIEAASLAYFGKLPKKLEAHQIALLIAIPQNPNARYPTPENHPRLQEARNHIGRLLIQAQVLPIEDKESVETAVYQHPLPTNAIQFPRHLPHLMDQISEQVTESGRTRIQTTLDSKVQSTLEEILHIRMKDYQRKGIFNTAIIVTNKHNTEIRGLIGNFDYWSGEHANTLPSYSLPRSAGSTLKPFIFAHTIDLGLGTPARIMEDIPHNFRGYQPRNYGASYHGLVTLSESLSQSYNIPFVELLTEIGLDPFLNHLDSLGIRHFQSSRTRLGLSVAVGLELTPLELNQAYTTLSRMEEASPLKVFEDTVLNALLLPNQKIAAEPISLGAKWLTGQTLRKRDRPDFPERMEYTNTQRPLAWKTGTSFGFHDAWTSGWGDDFVTTVWFGNLDHRSSVYLIGSEAAGTVFFEIMERLEQPFVAPKRPDDLVAVDVCAQTGLLPSVGCEETLSTWAPRNHVPTTQCTQHHIIFMDEEGKRSMPQCTNTPLRKERIWVPSVEYQQWSKIPTTLPALAESCQLEATLHSDLTIQSPDPRNRILLMLEDKKQDIPLIANHNDPHARLYWYIDDVYIGMSQQNPLWWTPTEGSHSIAVEDGNGQQDYIQVHVDAFGKSSTTP